MTDVEVNPIQIEDTPMLLQRALPPRLKLLCQGLIETTDRTGARSHSDQGLSHFAHLLGTDSCDEHLCESFSHLRFVALIAVKDLRVELSFSISGNLKIF